ncbi:MAG: PAS domain S-box protein [Actinobacteria bacterium]|nr:PAS domain S-box protein [Actinomycetota bacterium]
MIGTPKPRPRFSDEWLTAVLDALSEGVVAIDGEGRVTAANPAAEEILGFRIDEQRFTPWTRLGLGDLRSEDGEPVDPHPVVRALEAGEPLDRTPFALDGSLTCWVELATHILDPVAGAGTGVVVSLREVTQRLEAEHDRERILGVLRDVLAMTSHDLRGPIFTIRGYAQMLADHHAEGDAQLTDGLAAIERQVDHLARLVVDLSLTARLETGAIIAETEPVPVADIVADALQTSSATEVRVDVPDSLQVLADPDHARRILVNLLENAGRYGAPPVELTASAVDGSVDIAVSDHGPGIAPDLLPVLFERFTRGADAASDSTGLGLAIVASLAELNGGSVSYTAPGTGARFVVRLPAASASAVPGTADGRFPSPDDERPST